MSVTVKIVEQDAARSWDDYVSQNPNGTFLHSWGWRKVLSKTYRYKPFYIAAFSQSSKVVGVLPLFMMRTLRLKKILSSIPFGVYGGCVADNGQVLDALISRAKEIAKQEKVEYLELKNMEKVEGQSLVCKDRYVTYVKGLPAKKEDCLSQLPRKARAAARKAIGLGLSAVVDSNLLDEFYHVYAVSVRNLGTPVVPFSFIKNLACEFKDKVTVLSVRYEAKTIASVLTFLDKEKGAVLPYYGGALPEYFKCQPNNFMYLSLMEWGVENGYKYFDFGRSKKGSGSAKFKELMGFEPRDLHYQYFLNKAACMPDMSPANPAYSLPIRVWKNLPLPVTKVLGPMVVKYIGG